MFPFAILRDRRIHGDPVFQLEPAVRNYGLEEFPNLFCSHDLICNRHKSALRHQPSAISKGQKRANEQFRIRGSPWGYRKSSKASCPLGGWIKWWVESGRGFFFFFLARFPIIPRIPRPNEVRFITACWTIPINWPAAQYNPNPAGRYQLM